MAAKKSTKAPATQVRAKLIMVVQDLSIIQRLTQGIFAAENIQAAADIASSIEALATRAGRAADQCAQGGGDTVFCKWNDYPFLADTKEAEESHG